MNVTLPEPTKPVGYLELLRHNNNYRLLWLGQVVSLLGDWFNLIASASLMTSLSPSGAAIGVLFMIRLVAPFVVSPIAGVVADQYNRKYILLCTDILRAMIAFGFLLVRTPEQIWLLYTLTALQLGLSGFFFPAHNAILPDITSSRELGTANALGSATWSVMLALGAALGGLVSGLWGIYPALTIDGLTFIISTIFIGLVHYQPSPATLSSDKTIAASLKAYVDGLRYLQQRRHIFVITWHKGVGAILSAGMLSIIQVYIAETLFPIGEDGGISLGLMFSMAGIGTGLGPIVARYFTGDDNRRLEGGLIVGYLATALGLLMMVPLNSFSLILVGTVIRGIGGGILWVFSTQLLMQLLPADIRGRVFSVEFALFSLLSAFGAGLAGSLLDLSLAISTLLLWSAGLILLPGLLWWWWVIQRYRRQTEKKVQNKK